MPIQSPQLDDLRYDAVVQQLLRRIDILMSAGHGRLQEAKT